MSASTSWSEAALGEVCRVLSGATPKTTVPEYWGGDVRWITPNDMSKNRSQVVTHGERSLTQAGLDSCSARLIPAGSVIVSSRAPIGYVAIAGAEMCTNQGCKTAVPPDFIDPQYLYWFMLAMKSDLEARASGTTFKEISAKRFSETRLRWPPLEGQRQIVGLLEEHLSRLDAAEHSVQTASKRVGALESSALEAHFRREPRIPLGDLIESISAGKSFGASGAPARIDEWGIIKVSAMTYGAFNPDENKAIPADRVDPRFEITEGDLLVSRANTSEYVGASVLVGPVRPRLLLSDKSLRVKPARGVLTEWLWRALQAPNARRQISALSTGTKESMRNISQSALRRVMLPDADVDAQRRALDEYATVSTAVHRIRQQLAESEARSASLRRSLLSAAFSGRLTAGTHDLSDPEGNMVP